MLLQLFWNERWGRSRFSSVLYPPKACIVLQECSGFASRSKVYWEHKENINFEQIFTNIKSGCILFIMHYHILQFYDRI